MAKLILFTAFKTHHIIINKIHNCCADEKNIKEVKTLNILKKYLVRNRIM